MHWDRWMRKRGRLILRVNLWDYNGQSRNFMQNAHLEHTFIFYAFWLCMSILPLGNYISRSWKKQPKQTIIYGQLWLTLSIFTIFFIQESLTHPASSGGNPHSTCGLAYSRTLHIPLPSNLSCVAYTRYSPGPFSIIDHFTNANPNQYFSII